MSPHFILNGKKLIFLVEKRKDLPQNQPQKCLVGFSFFFGSFEGMISIQKSCFGPVSGTILYSEEQIFMNVLMDH